MKDKINMIMTKFDFNLVHKYMNDVQWKWQLERGFEIPNLIEIRETAISLLASVAESKLDFSMSRTGGFCATKTFFEETVEIRLVFELESYTN